MRVQAGLEIKAESGRQILATALRRIPRVAPSSGFPTSPEAASRLAASGRRRSTVSRMAPAAGDGQYTATAPSYQPKKIKPPGICRLLVESIGQGERSHNANRSEQL